MLPTRYLEYPSDPTKRISILCTSEYENCKRTDCTYEEVQCGRWQKYHDVDHLRRAITVINLLRSGEED
jgi:hypothetical protein